MGCPDWPKCFDQWVPPTSDSDLPENYQDIYVRKRKAKLERLTGLLRKLGMKEQAIAIENNPYALQAHPYSFKTAYIEYANRLWGALTGIFALLALVSSFQFRKTHRIKVWMTAIGVFGIVFNGWLGSVVVDTNLLEGMVTTHFVAAFLALSFLILGYKLPVDYVEFNSKTTGKLKLLSILYLVAISVQVISGAQTREVADAFLRYDAGHMQWLEQPDALWSSSFVLHRYLPFISLILLIMMYRMIRGVEGFPLKVRSFYTMVILFAVQGLFGAFNLWLGNNDISQLVHVTLGGFAFAYGLNWMLEVKRLQPVNE